MAVSENNEQLRMSHGR